MGGSRKRNKALGSIDAFWADFPRLHFFKALLDGVLELCLLVYASIAIYEDKNKVSVFGVFV